MIRTIALALAALTIAGPAAAHDSTREWVPCEYEDSTNCVWDARHMGNGQGDSFKVRRDGKVIFISHRRAHHLLFDHAA